MSLLPYILYSRKSDGLPTRSGSTANLIPLLWVLSSATSLNLCDYPQSSDRWLSIYSHMISLSHDFANFISTQRRSSWTTFPQPCFVVTCPHRIINRAQIVKLIGVQFFCHTDHQILLGKVHYLCASEKPSCWSRTTTVPRYSYHAMHTIDTLILQIPSMTTISIA